MFKVTSSAQAKFKEVLSQEQKEDAYIRLFISGIGWGGPKFGLALEESVHDGKDLVKEVEELKFVYEKTVTGHLDGKVIDYISGPQEGFVITGEGPSACDGCTSC